MLDEKREKQLQEVNKRLRILQNKFDKLQQQVKKPCESGWTLFRNHCYLFELSKASWKAAKKECERRQSHLVKIETSAENIFLKSMIQHMVRRKKEFWIGLNDLAKEGWFTWISDYSTVAYTDWHPGNPNNYRGNEDCCEIHEFHWNDDNCARPYCFICEKQAD
ncbi:Hypothetical predicted protein [Mytilus galloprovincialis]|uniref:C-type lectin domain-containing protein n=1 Tax=Mytilus galloprovincialis TaxID=29158 RepID=A0A8B6DG93_MYTGA|nr:Hypothetical predicted protein [Mytilus galloprovincialis]